MDGKGRFGKEKNEPVVPGDKVSFEAFIRSLNRRIRRLHDHLKQLPNARDYRARRRLERLIEQRGAALCQPPALISQETLRALREEVASG